MVKKVAGMSGRKDKLSGGIGQSWNLEAEGMPRDCGESWQPDVCGHRLRESGPIQDWDQHRPIREGKKEPKTPGNGDRCGGGGQVGSREQQKAWLSVPVPRQPERSGTGTRKKQP